MKHTNLWFHVGVFCLVAGLNTFAAETPSAAALRRLDAAQNHSTRENWSFQVGYNEMMEYSVDEITGLQVPSHWKEKALFIRPKLSRALPSKFDWREAAGGLTPIKNQGRCGSCWAFGTVGVMESVLKIKENWTKSLSEQYLVSCDGRSLGCNGGYYAHDLHKTPGAVLESTLPYTARNGRCPSGLEHTDHIMDWAYVGDGNNSPSVEEIKNAIFAHGPVAVTVTANGAMQAYRGGVFNACANGRTNHIVDLVGWNDQEGTWIMRNSWGTSWGEQGYMRIKYDCSRVGETATFVIYKPACNPQPIAFTGDDQTIRRGGTAMLGGMPVLGQKYKWTPSEGLDDPNAPMPVASPTKDTIYTLQTDSSCGHGVKSVTVHVQD